MKKSIAVIAAAAFFVLLFAAFTVFFDQAVLVRRGTFYHMNSSKKVVALTFDDGPSPVWTPKILDALKEKSVKATFFMLGKHVEAYPDVARRVVQEGHDIGNHTFSHPVMLFSGRSVLKSEILKTRDIIKRITGKTTGLFRPPKAWITASERREIKDLGYVTVLWTLNSKDWVTFDDKYIVRYLVKNVHPGDIILFHDSGGVFGTEGGNRNETVKTIPKLVDKLREKGYSFVTVSQLLEMEKENEN
ncbi:MAG: polysaccharide deacetylase family protein [Candidatus Omnitrophica bacterium]|nr:polysaccharide deacetylase family protein [Candidatus Omnitrophota bacterium]